MHWTWITLVALLGACTTSEEQAALDRAESRWDRNAPDLYTFTWQRGCECDPDATRPIRIDVMNDEIAAALYLDGARETVASDIRESLFTIDGVFRHIQAAIDEDAFQIRIQYDASLGHPTSVAIDYDDRIADEEFFLQVTNLGPLADPISGFAERVHRIVHATR